jgi:RHS repeat-associated protein
VNEFTSFVVGYSINDTTLAVFPQLVETNMFYYDSINQSEYIQTAMMYASYDEYGNVTYAIDKGDVSDFNDDIHIYIQYDYDTTPYIVSNPEELKVSDSSGKILRRRWGDFDDYGNLERLEQYYAEGENPVYQFRYNGFGNTKRSIDASGYYVDYEYDDEVHTYIKKTTDAFNYFSEATYEYTYGTEKTLTDTNGNMFTKKYDIFGRLQSIETEYDSPNYPSVEFQYFHTDFPARAVTKNKILFNDDHNPITYDESETLDTVIIIDGIGRVMQTKKEGEVLIDGDTTPTHGMNVSGKVIYDELGRVWQQGQPVFQDEVDTRYYDAELRNPTITTYDVLGRSLVTELSDEKKSTLETEYRFENGFFKTIVTDPNNNRKISYSDVRENIVRIDQFNHGKTLTTRYEYSLLNEIEKVADAKNNITSVTYDSLGRRTSINNPDMGLVEFGYDIASNLIWKQDNNLRVRDKRINYEYTFNRLDRIVYPDSAPVVYHYGDENAQHNRIGRIWKVEDESGSKEFYYGKLGQEERVVQTYNSMTLGLDPISFETQYGYDYLGRMNWIHYPDDDILHYEYDNGGQISHVYSKHRNHTFHYIDHIYYDEFGQRKQIAYSNGVTTNYTYDETRRWLEHIETKNSKRTFQNMQYEFDQVGNVTGTVNVATKDYGVGTITTEQSYEYDDLYQLTKAVGTNLVTAPSRLETTYQQDFRYDEIGNMTNKTSAKRINPMNGNPNDLNYNFIYQYNPNKPHQAYKIGDWTYSYDSNGNVIRKNLGGGETQSDTYEDFNMENPNRQTEEHNSSNWLTRESGTTTTTVGTTNETPYDIENPIEEEQEEIDVLFKWNEENRLIESTVSGETTKYLYDGTGERTIKKGKFGETTYVNKFFQLQNRDVITKHIFVGESRIISKLSHLDDFGDLDFEKNNQYYYHGDHLGNTTYITDKDGNEWEHFEYTPYGETWITEENRTHSFGYRFTGKELDEETNLYYFGARYLDAQTSRWLSCDPILDSYLDGEPAGGVYNSVNMNLYHYGANNPLKYVDPNGMYNDNDRFNGDYWGVSESYKNQDFGSYTFIGYEKGYVNDDKPYTRNYKWHIYSIRDGVVEGINENYGTYGKTIWIRNSDGVLAQYSHLKSIDVETGQRIHEGDSIGVMGSSGGSFARHLHLSLYKSDITLDDLHWNNGTKYKKSWKFAVQFGSIEDFKSYLKGGAWPTNTKGTRGGYYKANYGYAHEGWDFGRTEIKGWIKGLNNGLWIP